MTTWEPFATWATMLTWFVVVVSVGVLVCLLVLVILRMRARRKAPLDRSDGHGRRVSVAPLIGIALFLIVGVLNGIPVIARESAPVVSVIGTPGSLVLLAAAVFLLVERPHRR